MDRAARHLRRAAQAGWARLKAADQGLTNWVIEAMEPVGVVTKRAIMMGGATQGCQAKSYIASVVSEA